MQLSKRRLKKKVEHNQTNDFISKYMNNPESNEVVEVVQEIQSTGKNSAEEELTDMRHYMGILMRKMEDMAEKIGKCIPRIFPSNYLRVFLAVSFKSTDERGDCIFLHNVLHEVAKFEIK